MDRNVFEALLEGLGAPVVCSGKQIDRWIPINLNPLKRPLERPSAKGNVVQISSSSCSKEWLFSQEG